MKMTYNELAAKLKEFKQQGKIKKDFKLRQPFDVLAEEYFSLTGKGVTKTKEEKPSSGNRTPLKERTFADKFYQTHERNKFADIKGEQMGSRVFAVRLPKDVEEALTDEKGKPKTSVIRKLLIEAVRSGNVA